jgi:hypothetical protein
MFILSIALLQAYHHLLVLASGYCRGESSKGASASSKRLHDMGYILLGASWGSDVRVRFDF